MKKSLAAILTVVIILAAFAGCGGKDTGTSVEPLVNDVASAVVEATAFKDSLSQLEGDAVFNIYNLEESQLEDKAVYVGTGATAEEVAVFKAKTADDVEKIKAAIQERLEDQTFNFQNYVPGEMTKIENPLIATNGNYVMLVLADDSAAAQQAFDAQFTEK